METAKGKTGEEAITTLADRIDSFKKYSSPHSRLIALLATHLARRFGLAQSDIHAIAEAAFLHDIGLHAMKPAYQLTPGPLSFEERMDLWRHPIIGEQQMAKRDAMRHAQLLVRWHHEWWNGWGYPDQLSFEDIPIGARILRAVELYSALISDRPYRAAFSQDQAIDTLKASAGIESDPYVIKALITLIEDINAQAKQTEPPPLEAPSEREPALREPPLNQQTPPPAHSAETSPVEPISIEPNSVESTSPAVESPSTVEGASGSPAAQDPLAVSTEAPALSDPLSELRERVETDRIADSIHTDSAASASSWGAPRLDDAVSKDEPLAKEPDRSVMPASASPAPASVSRLAPAAAESLKLIARVDEFKDEQPRIWRGWSGSHYNKKSLLGFEASVLRQIEFRSIAIPFCGWARLDMYLKMWGKHILANDPRAWAGVVARATVEAKAPLSEDHIARVLEDVYVPGARLSNPALRRWFSETDAWWMDNLRRNVEALDDESLRAQAIMLGLMTGDYALSFDDDTRELRRPLTTVFWRLAGRAFLGLAGHPHNRSYNLPADEFIKHARADLLYLNLPAAPNAEAGAESRSEWRESWVRSEPDDNAQPATPPQSKASYLASIDRLFRAASGIRIWAIEYQEIGLATAAEIVELIKVHRPVRATYSKDLTEVAGGLRNYIIVAEKGSAN